MAPRSRSEVWLALAEQFLDTESRQEIPRAALICAEAGLSSAEASEVWHHEVAPALEFNLWLVAGEWAAWDPEWLTARIERQRGRGAWRRFLARFKPQPLAGVWLAIERCLELLLGAPSASARQDLAADLEWLARHYFDVCPRELSALPTVQQGRVRALYPAPFQHSMQPALVAGEALRADSRVRAALEWIPTDEHTSR